MPKTRRLLREEITYSAAQDKEVNILHQLGYHDKQQNFFNKISYKIDWIEAVVAHYLRFSSPNACHVASMQNWFHDSYNVCIPITITGWMVKQQCGQHVLLRLPLPAYVWLQENCPDVPIPRLYGFAMSTGEVV
ncbi:hypothetical protein B7463_g4503, partial [Scytalidium lignicola]